MKPPRYIPPRRAPQDLTDDDGSDSSGFADAHADILFLIVVTLCFTAFCAGVRYLWNL